MATQNSPDQPEVNRNGEQDATDAAFADDNVHATSTTSTADRASDEIRNANDRALRAQAELENFRKRMRREMDDERRYAAMALISDLLPVIDNLDRAIEASESNPAAEGLLQGVKMVQNQFLATLERHHCRRLGVVGEPFDPSQHQALAQEPSGEYAAGSVTRVTQFGYQLHDRIVRPAQVFVSTGPAST